MQHYTRFAGGLVVLGACLAGCLMEPQVPGAGAAALARASTASAGETSVAAALTGRRDPCPHDGDANLDGTVTAADAQFAFAAAVGAVTPSDAEACAADCNGDAALTAADAQGVFAAVLGVGGCPRDLPGGHPCAGDAQCASGACPAGVCCAPGFAGAACDTCVRYVDLDATPPSADGLNWPSALPTVQAGIDAARAAVGEGMAARCDVWVAEGTYVICPPDGGGNTVQLQPTVDVYGGFAGTENAREQRDFRAHVTTLDGANRCAHIVTGSDDARLDGFTVTRGSNYGGGGAGMRNVGTSPTVANCTFSHHRVDCESCEGPCGGGAMYNADNAPSVVGCTFDRNDAVGYTWNECVIGVGAAMYNDRATVFIADSTFSRNAADNEPYEEPGGLGGALYNRDSTVELVNTQFINNWAVWDGDALYNLNSDVRLLNASFWSVQGYADSVYSSGGRLTAANSIFWSGLPPQIVVRNGTIVTVAYSDVQGGYPGTGNIDADPLYVSTELYDLHLSPLSPCIDRADGDVAPPTDMDGWARCDDPATANLGRGSPPYADMGAYEHVVPGCALSPPREPRRRHAAPPATP